MLLVIMWYKHTVLSKVHVSGIVRNINTGLVKDSMSYTLHNVWELIIMQMRHKAGIRVVKEGGEGNPAKPGNNRRVTTRHSECG